MTSPINSTFERSSGTNRQPSNWPNSKSALMALTITNSYLCNRLHLPLSNVKLLNIPLRLVSSILEIRDKKYGRLAFQVCSFAALFFKNGLIVSAAIDLAAEFHNIWLYLRPQSAAPLGPRLSTVTDSVVRLYNTSSNSHANLPHVASTQPMNRQEALSVLNLEDPFTQEALEESRTDKVDVLLDRKARASAPLAVQFQNLIDRVEAAHRFLKG